MYFESGQLSPEQHKLVVTNSGGNTLNINYFVQQDAPSATSIIDGATSGSSPGKPSTYAIIGGVIGGIVLITLLRLIGIMFFLHRRNNGRSKALSDMPYNDPSPDVVNPFPHPPLNPTFTFLPVNYNSNGQSLLSQLISTKFSNTNQPSDPASTSNSGGIPPLPSLLPQFSSPAFIPPSYESNHLPLTGSQTNLDGASPRVPETTTDPSIQLERSPTASARYVWHEDSGIRIPPAEDDRDIIIEIPPVYTPAYY